MSTLVLRRGYGSPVILPKGAPEFLITFNASHGQVGFHKTYTNHEDLLWFGVCDWSGGEGIQGPPKPLDPDLVIRVQRAFRELPEDLRKYLSQEPREFLMAYIT